MKVIYERDVPFESLLPFCRTERQREIVEYRSTHTENETAKHFDIGARNVRKAIHLLTEKAKKQTPSNMVTRFDEPIPAPFSINRISTMYDTQTGESKIAWVISNLEREAQIRMLLDSVMEAMSTYKPLPKIALSKKAFSKDKVCILPMGDPHLGMYAFHKESGDDFDCDIAEKNLRGVMSELINKAPPCETCLIVNLGDFFHSDSSANTTTKGTRVDVDTRWSRVLQIGINLMIDCIRMALTKHKNVIVKNVIGNHDKETSQVLSICLMQTFANNKRVTIAEPSDPFFCYEFGKNAIYATHSDLVKPKQMMGVLANYYPEVWGRTEHRLALAGHWHHESRQETNGLVVEIFNTLASSDAWHHASGYRSKRNMKLIIIDKESGEEERYTKNLSRTALKVYK